MGLGQFLPGVGEQEGQQLESQWNSWLSNPVNKAFLLQAGIGMLTPTWGNQVGQALGAGAEAAGRVGQNMQQQEMAGRQMGMQLAEGERNRSSRESMNREDNKTRMDAARLQSSTSRANSQDRISAEKTPYQHRVWSQAYDTFFRQEKSNQIITKKTDDQILQESQKYADDKLNQMRGKFGMEGPAPAATPGAPPGPQGAVPQGNIPPVSGAKTSENIGPLGQPVGTPQPAPTAPQISQPRPNDVAGDKMLRQRLQRELKNPDKDIAANAQLLLNNPRAFEAWKTQMQMKSGQ